MPKTLKMIDLFAGAGGLSEGFIRAGFEPIAHVEQDPAACNTLRTRVAYHWLKSKDRLEEYYNYLRGKISREEFYETVPKNIFQSVIEAEVHPKNNREIFENIRRSCKGKKINLVVGGPPCQAYSMMGRSVSPTNMVGDSRNYLYLQYVEFLREFKPKYFVFENVTGLLSAEEEDGSRHLDHIKKSLESAGYRIVLETLNASDFGIPQNRKRIVIIGKRGTRAPKYPRLEKAEPPISISSLFGDLPPIQASENETKYCYRSKELKEALIQLGIREEDSEAPLSQYSARPNTKQDLEIYSLVVEKWNKKKERLKYSELPQELRTHKNTASHLDRFKVVAGDCNASHTVVAHISKDGHHYIHPDASQNRSLTPREAARLQTFPDDYYFEGVAPKKYRTRAFKQIGNAVPVLLAQRIAEALLKQWNA
ncbi:DNA cytosine methyltransferase [bacterium]|nr:DNA cytosine methyltransferase [bacterium]